MEAKNLNDTFTPQPLNGTYISQGKRRIVTETPFNRNASTAAKPKQTVTKPVTPVTDRSEYKWEKYVMIAALVLVGAAGIQLALSTGSGFLMKLGQVLGFTASTVSLLVVKYGLHNNRYLGKQRKYAENFFVYGTVFESLTLLAKYAAWFVTPYLYLVSFTLPALILGMHKLIQLDEKRRLTREKEENAVFESLLLARQDTAKKQNRMRDVMTNLQVEENLQRIRREKMLAQSTGWGIRRKSAKAARGDVDVIYNKVQRVKALPAPKKSGGGDDKKRRTMGPRAENAVNGIYCKNEKCGEKLPEGKKKYCSDRCSSAQRAREHRRKRKGE